MRKTILSIMFLLILLLAPNMVFAAEGDVAKIGETGYATLTEAVAATPNDGTETTITLLKDVELETVLDITSNVKLDLNGFSITPISTLKSTTGLLMVHNGGTLTINDTVGTGKISGGIENNNLYAAVTITKKETYNQDKTAKLIVNGGTLEGYYYGIAGNGSRHNTEITINGGHIKGAASVGAGIFHPQSGKVTVNGGTVEGAAGIEMRAGELVVEGGTIIGTVVPVTVEPNGSGTTSSGAGIAVAQHTTKLDTSVVVNGGTIQGYSAIYESNPQNNEAEAIAKVSIAIEGGNFQTINGGTVVVYSENKTKFITGGTFSTDVSNYVAEYHVCNTSGDNYVVQKLHNITVNVKDSVGGTASSDVIRAVEGRNIGLYITPETGYELKEIIITDASGVQTKTTNHYFVMPNSDVTVEVVYSKIVKQEVQIPDAVEDAEKVEDVLLDSLKQDASFKEIVENNNVEVKVQLSEDKVQAAEKEEIEGKLEKQNLTIGKYFDLTIAVINKDTGVTEGTLDVLTDNIKFTIEIPEDLPEVAEGFTRKYYIIRNHNGVVEYLDVVLAEDGKSLSFETNKFSTYALAYADVENEVSDGETIQQPETDEKDDTPKTGAINISAFIWIAIAAIAILAIINTKKSSKHSK